MKTTKISPAVLAAATGMLQPFVPGLSPQSLVAALKNHEDNARNDSKQTEKPMTRQDAAALLGVSLNTLNRYMNTGILRRVHVGPRLVRIDPQSVRDLLNGAHQIEEVQP